MIPTLDERGLLPAGCHDATWPDIEARFASNPLRKLRLEQAHRCVRLELQAVATGLEMVLGGSYFSDKPDPGDIDCTIVLPVHEIPARAGLIALADDGGKGRLWIQYRVEFYITVALPGYNDFRLFFQYVGEKTADIKHLHAKDLRGTIKVEPWTLG